MRDSWNIIRTRASKFAKDWKDAEYEKGETQTFYNEFFEIFGKRRREVARYEEPVKKLGDRRGFMDLFWKGVLLVEQKSAGRNLGKAKEQALDYFPGLKPWELPRYLLLSDFRQFELYDLELGTETKFPLTEFPKHVEAFGFILGIERRVFHDQDPVNIAASELMGRLHDALEESGYTGHDLERFLVRLLFCLFADDTGIFETRDIFLDLIVQRTNPDGSDVGAWLTGLFDALNTPSGDRQKTLDEDLARFPYVNGDLFEERLRVPSFCSDMRQLLIEACDFSWDAISPAIFGSLFQSVMDKEERRAKGAHYTTEKNILKVIEPLFLDDLRGQFEKIKARRDSGKKAALVAFHNKLGTLTFFDPACGCGNFLIISYREIRNLEIEVLREMIDSQAPAFRLSDLLKIDVDRFYGIELSEFPARIAEVALWMMDHIMNNRISSEFGEFFARIPLRKSPHILHADSLETDWNEVIPGSKCSYVLGNPPFAGAKYQSTEQREQVRRIAQLGGTGGTLDYVTAWFLKAGAYVSEGNAKIGFVATNSITQGEQVAQLWPLLFERYHLEISFAHRTFAWGSDARGKAHVHVIILGLSRSDQEPPQKRLFSYPNIHGEPVETKHKALTPYLFEATNGVDRHRVVREAKQSVCGAPRIVIGSKPIDGGFFIFTKEEREDFLKSEPLARKFMRPFVGSLEYLNGGDRWILALQDASPQELRNMPKVRERVVAVKDYRKKSHSAPTRKLAETPTEYHVTVIPKKPFLIIPEVSSERREYVPIGWLKPPTIPSNLVRVFLGATLWHFGILTSRMMMCWLRHIGGRLKSDYRFSINLVYNTFPWPVATEPQRKKIEELAQSILATRAQYPKASLSALYDPDLMKPDLRKAHRNMDIAVDRIYRKTPFQNDRERVEHLFALYEKLESPLLADSKPKRGRSRNSRG